MTVREFNKNLKGEISVFLSLITIILVSFIIAILDSAVIKTYGNERKIDAQAAVFSVFGEYEDELFNDYKILAVDSSYGKTGNTEKYIEDKLRYFGTVDMDHTITGIQLLTDENCAEFRRQAIEYAGGTQMDENIAVFEEKTLLWEEMLQKGEDALRKDEEYDTALNELKGSYSAENNEENIFEILEDSKKSSLLDEILPDGTNVSERKLDKNQLASNRKLRTGRGVKYDTSNLYSVMSDLSFNEYVLEEFKNMTSADNEDEGLLYETEYIVNGSESDRENLEDIIRKIIYMRILINYEHIMNSTEKIAEIEALSTTISIALTAPEIEEVISFVMKWVWAYKESKCDVAALMAGLKIPEIKTADTWNSGLFDCFTTNVTYNLEGSKTGLEYKDFLRILLYAGDARNITFRCVDMAEVNIRSVRENFKADNCFVKLKVQNNAELLKGFTYNFPIEFGYR